MRDFHHSVNVLVKAYLNDTLAHKMCTACAVGNLVADAFDFKPRLDPTNDFAGFDCNKWDSGDVVDWYQALGFHRIGEHVEMPMQLAATGYTLDEIDLIERAFEGVEEPKEKYPYWCRDDAYMLRGLFAVVDVLADIHKIDLTEKEHAKTLFVR